MTLRPGGQLSVMTRLPTLQKNQQLEVCSLKEETLANEITDLKSELHRVAISLKKRINYRMILMPMIPRKRRQN